MSEITKEVQEVIDYVLRYEPDVIFKECKNCGRNLPCHEWFYQPTQNRNRYNCSANCKECTSVIYHNGLHKFENNLDKYWYYYIINEIKQNSRVMSDKQLAKYYNRSSSDIEFVLYQVIKTSQKKRMVNLTEEEVIQNYNAILNKERDLLPRGFFNNEYYTKVLLKHLIVDILHWDKNTFINNFNADILNEHGLFTIRKTRNFNDIFQIIISIFNWDINIWELKRTNSGIGFWLIEDNVNDAQQWLKNKLIEDKNINNIYEAYKYGLANIISEYYLKGLFKIKYKNNCFAFFQDVYNEEFDLNYYNENYYNFDIQVNPVSLKYNGIIYKLTKKYNDLDEVKKTLINEIIKYCEENKYFPVSQDLLSKKGCICYIYFKRYFSKYSDIYKYILPLQDRVSYCWCEKENRVNYVKFYCEEKCNESIIEAIKSTDKLIQWVTKYFTQNIIGKEMYWANEYVSNLYELLTDAYPEIKNDKIFFDWEWQAFYPKTQTRRIEILRELVLYRLNDLIVDLKNDIPKYLNNSFINSIYPKFYTYITKKKFLNFYEWACLAFPEYADIWTEKDFGIVIAKDNTILSSYQEKDVYEYIKFDLNIKYLKYIGNKRSGEYVYSLEDISDYKATCPDFVIEYLNINNKKIKLIKPIIIEFYGYYHPNNKNIKFENYVNKTNVKNEFYQSNKDIDFIGLYPDDLKNGLEGVKNKIADKLNSYNMVL